MDALEFIAILSIGWVAFYVIKTDIEANGENMRTFFTYWDNKMIQSFSQRKMENKIKQSKIKINRKKHII